jgi:hypothetical protein
MAIAIFLPSRASVGRRFQKQKKEELMRRRMAERGICGKSGVGTTAFRLTGRLRAATMFAASPIEG